MTKKILIILSSILMIAQLYSQKLNPLYTKNALSFSTMPENTLLCEDELEAYDAIISIKIIKPT